MKKIFTALAVISVAALSLTGCLNKKDNSTAEAPAQPAPTKNINQRVITVGYAQVGHESAWRIANSNSFEQTFSKENNYNLIFVDSDNNQKFRLKPSAVLSNRM